jgi:hypothetical protein
MCLRRDRSLSAIASSIKFVSSFLRRRRVPAIHGARGSDVARCLTNRTKRGIQLAMSDRPCALPVEDKFQAPEIPGRPLLARTFS